MSELTLSFEEKSDFDGFQVKDMHTFSKARQAARRLKRKKIPKYRRINKYFKSPKQYWKERNRRKRAYELFTEGFTFQQIAEKLGVCAKTVSRDIKRTQRYHTGQFNRMIRQVRAERDAEYTKRYGNLSLNERRRQLHDDWKFITKMFRLRQSLRETVLLTIRVDEIMKATADKNVYGRPFIKLNTRTLTLPINRLRLKIYFTAENKKIGEAVLSCGDFGCKQHFG